MSLIHEATIATTGPIKSVQIVSMEVKINDNYEPLSRLGSELYSKYATAKFAEKIKQQLVESGSLSYSVNYSNGKSIFYDVTSKFVVTAHEMLETCKRGMNDHDV